MAPQHWQQVKEILSEALEREEGEPRTTFVAEKCGEDTALRQEIETYLNTPDQSFEACAENIRQSFLGKIWSQPIGHRIGAYRIEREIGRGGMGAVFLAARADGEFEKQVAIKLLKRGTDTDEIVRRFRVELQILAQLEHPSIARLLDAGTTEDGLPYFVMEYVAGVPITKFVRNRLLSIRQRLELFLKVCAAVERAHRDRIVHRDLKPTNILVTADGEPKLLDFGIAKLLEPSGGPDATATSQQRLTPTCASPEQTRGKQITVASDIYALGALLYELLTDRTPHQFSTARPSPEELAQVVCEQEPTPPSLTTTDGEIRRQLQGDLDNIVLCALRKEPEGRYPSVAEFAEDIQRYLAARPVHARPKTTFYRVQRFVARNKGRNVVAGFAAVVILLIAGLVLFVGPKLQDPARVSGASDNAAAPPITEKSIAVLPFENFNNDKESSYFVDGVQDDILTDLSRVSNLKVMSRGAVAAYRGKNRNAREIGRVLGVAHVLEGSVQKSGNRVRVNARLVDTRNNAQIWAERYDRNVDDLFALQSELAQTIVAQLKVTLSAEQKAAIETRPTDDMQAYDLYLRARELLAQFADKDGQSWRKAAELIDAAIARDPKFTLAYCLGAHADILLYRYFDHTPARLNRAKESAMTALALSPKLGESHLAMAQYYYHGFRDYARAQSELNLAAFTLSGDAEFLTIAQVTERRLGRWNDALRDGQKAVALNPRDPICAATLIDNYMALRNYAEAGKVVDQAIARLPANSAGDLWARKFDAFLASGDLDRARATIEEAPSNLEWKDSMRFMLALYERNYAGAERLIKTGYASESMALINALMEGQIHRWLGDAEKSRQGFERAKDLAQERLRERLDDPLLSCYLAVAHAGLGQKEDAVRIAKRAAGLYPISRDSIDGANCISSLAEVYALSGDREGALGELAKVVHMPSGPTYGDLRFNPMWDELRSDPRFDKLLAQAKAPPQFE